MKVIVLGSGVIGVTSAWYLRQAGHDVTVVDRQPAPGRETSFANGGQISWSSATPWAAPDIPLKALSWLFRPHSPLVLRPRLDPAMWVWLLHMLRNCTPARFALNRRYMVELARYSHDCLVRLRSEINIRYDQDTRGTLIVFRRLHDLHAAAKQAETLAALDIPFELVDRAGCIAREPALAPVSERVVGGMYFSADEVGDCRVFTEQLATASASKGVEFVANTSIKGFRTTDRRITCVVTEHGEMTADAYVVACGSYTPLLMRPLGIGLPVYPVKGYSMTLPISDVARAPLGTVTDEAYKVVVTRLGDRIRAAGTAELAGYDLSLRPERCATIAHVVRDLFPAGADFSRAEYWCGLRPMTPDNPPVVSATSYRNLYLNTGHGTLGWTMACGSGRILADLVGAESPAIPTQPYSIERYGQ